MLERRQLLTAGVTLAAARALPSPSPRAAYNFATARLDIAMTVEFYDRYSSRGFSFRDLSLGRGFCLSASGEADRACAEGFAGSLAIVRYNFRPRSEPLHIANLREHVRTIDQDARLHDRPPFDRTIDLRDGAASDIQAFGYETPEAAQPATGGLWYYFRQDLYFPARPAPFLVIHWRHTLGAIRILDVIPGEGTWLVRETR